MNILALDLGTNTGFAYNTPTEFHCGTWELATPSQITKFRKIRMDRRADPRVYTLRDRIKKVLDANPIDRVIFEDVQFSSFTYQTQLWASLRAAVWLACDRPNAAFPDCVPTGSLKKFAGHGAATKEMMGMFLAKRDPRFFVGREKKFNVYFRPADSGFPTQRIDDNAVDAVWLWKWGLINLGKRT